MSDGRDDKPDDGEGEPSAGASGQGGRNASPSANKGKEKLLRFVLPEESSDEDEVRSQQETEVENVRMEPFENIQSGSLSKNLQAVHGDVAEDGSESSNNYDTDIRSSKSMSRTNKSLFYALKSSPTKTGADYVLLFSAHMRSLSGVQQALKNGANVNVNQECRTPIIIATENNAKQLVEFLVDVEGINLDCQNIFGNTPLMIALRQGFDEIATLLIKKGAGINIANNLERTPLHEALLRQQFPLVRLLIQHHHKFDVSDCFGERPIYTCSVKKPNLPLLNILLDAGASSEYENETGLSLLSRVILNEDNFRIVRRLVLDGADVNHQDRFCKRTPLHMAAMINSSRTAKFLVDHGSNPDLRTINGLTAFDIALYYKCFETAEYLVNCTRNPAVKLDNFRETLLSRLSHSKSAAFLLRTSNTKNEEFVPSKKHRLSYIQPLK